MKEQYLSWEEEFRQAMGIKSPLDFHHKYLGPDKFSNGIGFRDLFYYAKKLTPEEVEERKLEYKGFIDEGEVMPNSTLEHRHKGGKSAFMSGQGDGLRLVRKGS